jgi:hypothetical protein
MFKALVHRQDDQLARAAQLALVEDAVKIGLNAGIVGLVIGEDFLDSLGGHRVSLSAKVFRMYSHRYARRIWK